MALLDKNCEQHSDQELVRLTLSDQNYFLCLVKRYKSPLLRYVRRISNLNPDDSEDVLQDVFLKIYKNLNGYDPDFKFSSWVYSITRHQVINNYRRHKKFDNHYALEVEDDTLSKIASELDLSQELDNKFLKQMVSQVLARLDSKYRDILVLKFLEEKNYKEISEIIHKPLGTVASLMNRAKKEFKKQASEELFKD